MAHAGTIDDVVGPPVARAPSQPQSQGGIAGTDEHDPTYIKWKLLGHLAGAALSFAGVYELETVGKFGLSVFGLAAASEIIDYVGDQAGFNYFRLLDVYRQQRYRGITGKFRFLYDGLSYAIRHIPGDLVGKALGYAATVGLALGFGAPVYLALLAPRAIEIGGEILFSTYFTKGHRQSQTQRNALPPGGKPGDAHMYA